MAYEIEFKSSVVHDFKKLDKKNVGRVLSQITELLSTNPSASGERLHGEFSGFYKLRIGEYRVVYTIIKDKVLVLKVGHRSKVYER